MANSWNGPQLGSPIRTDVPELQKKLIALLKQDPTSVANIPSGAKRLVNTSGVQWQVQQYNGSSWAAIGKLMHDVDKLDGYHAAITPTANTVAVRNADKKLEGDITGNAATASSATTLSETLPVNKGGTGATTSAQARTNLGVPPTSHASSGTTYGLGSNANYGHVRGDGVTTNVVSGEVVAKDIAIRGDSADLASARGQIGNRASLSGIDYNSLVKFGYYVVEGAGSTNTPTGTAVTFYVDVFETKYSATTRVLQIAYRSGNTQQYVRSSLDSGETWSQWEKSIYNTDYATASTPGIVKPGTGMSVDSAGSLGVNDSVVRTTGNQTIAGAKTFTYSLYSKSNTLIRTQRDDISIFDTSREAYTGIMLAVVEDKDKKRFGGLEVSANRDGSRSIQFTMRNRADTGWLVGIRVNELVDGTCFCETPPPPEDSNANHIPTTAWVRSRIAESKDSTDTEISAASMVPDWGRKAARSLNTAYTASENGHLYVRYNCSPGDQYISLEYTPSGKEMFTYHIGRSYGSASSNGTTVIPIAKGDTYKITGGNVTETIVFIPAKK